MIKILLNCPEVKKALLPLSADSLALLHAGGMTIAPAHCGNNPHSKVQGSNRRVKLPKLA